MPALTVSVIVPNYNHAHYLPASLNAILAQSFRPIEVIVVDDASTDGSVEVVEALCKQDPIVRLIRNPKNIGPIPSVNRALALSTGDYLCFQSADDLVLPGFIEKSISLLSKYPQASICVAKPGFFTDIDPEIQKPDNCLPLGNLSRYISPKEFVLLQRYSPFNIWGHSSLFRRTAVAEVGQFDPAIAWHADWFLYNIMAIRHGICYVPEVLSALRIAEGSYSSKKSRSLEQQVAVLARLMDVLKTPQYSDVLPFFLEANLMAQYGPEFIQTIQRHPRHNDLLTRETRFRIRAQQLRSTISPFFPNSAKVVIRAGLARWRRFLTVSRKRHL